MQAFLKKLREQAAKAPKQIVFPDGHDPRVQKAAAILKAESLAFPILLNELRSSLKKDPAFEGYVHAYRKARSCSEEEAREASLDPTTFATLMVHQGDADGMVAGPSEAARDRISPALRLLKPLDPKHRVSGFFFMVLSDETDHDAANGGILMFADCAVNVAPSSTELAQIALDSAKTARAFGLNPNLALLSFSTKGSSQDPSLNRIREAVTLIQKEAPDLKVDGELQVDAALMDEIALIKAPNSATAGHANVLIFPDLNSGNIAYKLVERLASAKAVGPILQGLRKPINEVSRGSTAEDIVNTSLLTVIQAQQGSGL